MPLRATRHISSGSTFEALAGPSRAVGTIEVTARLPSIEPLPSREKVR